MARVVDRNLARQRRGILDNLALARSFISMMQDKTGELHARTHRSVGGHVVGDELVARAAASVDQLAQALSNLARASDYTHGVDVTVEVPDPEPGHGR